MKTLVRTLAAAVALTLPLLGLTGCTDSGDCDAAGTTITLVSAQQQLVDGKGGGGKSSSRSGSSSSGSGKSGSGKTSGHVTVHHDDDDDCGDDD